MENCNKNNILELAVLLLRAKVRRFAREKKKKLKEFISLTKDSCEEEIRPPTSIGKVGEREENGDL